MEGARDRRGQARGDGHREERGIQRGSVREPEADVRRPAGRVDSELLPQTSHDPEDLSPCVSQGADGHDERVDDDVLFRDAVVGGTRDDRPRHLEPDVGVVRDARLVVRDRDDGCAVLRDERKHRLQPVLFARDRVDEGFPAIDGEPRLERRDDRGVDGERDVGDVLHELDRLREDGGLVRERDAGVDVEHLRTGLDLRDRVRDDRLEVPRRHLLRELLAPGRVDPLADDHERTREADDDLPRGARENGVGHGPTPVGP